jgi:flagellar FliJ protein
MLAEDLKNARASEERLQLLINFRHEYEGRFRGRSALGYSAEAWRNFRLFLAQLDDAVEAQRDELSTRRITADARKGAQATAGVRLKSYEGHAGRREEDWRAATDHRERKENDEIAAMGMTPGSPGR